MDIRLIVFDLDGTLVKYENSLWYGSWDAIGYAAGLKEEFDSLTSYYLPRVELYEEWANANARLLRGLSVKDVEKRVFPPPYSRGVKETVPLLAKEYKTMILSSGADMVAERVCKELGIESFISNRLLKKDGLFTGSAVCDVPLEGKIDKLREITREFGIPLSDVCAVGDNENDIEMLCSVGLGIAFEPRTDQVRKSAKFVIDDFHEMLEILANLYQKREQAHLYNKKERLKTWLMRRAKQSPSG